MRIVMIGSGYVGLVSGACLSDFGHDVGAGHASLFIVLAQRTQDDSTLLQFLGAHEQGHQRARPVGRLHL